MAKDAEQSRPAAMFVRASARRIWIEHGAKAHNFAAERLKASIDQAEIEMWRAIVAALRVISSSQRVPSSGRT